VKLRYKCTKKLLTVAWLIFTWIVSSYLIGEEVHVSNNMLIFKVKSHWKIKTMTYLNKNKLTILTIYFAKHGQEYSPTSSHMYTQTVL
jgi:hypothetical protein